MTESPTLQSLWACLLHVLHPFPLKAALHCQEKSVRRCQSRSQERQSCSTLVHLGTFFDNRMPHPLIPRRHSKVSDTEICRRLPAVLGKSSLALAAAGHAGSVVCQQTCLVARVMCYYVVCLCSRLADFWSSSAHSPAPLPLRTIQRGRMCGHL